MLGQSWRVIDRTQVPLIAGTIGVYAGVEDNGMNSLASQLNARAAQLDQREAALASAQQRATSDPTTLFVVTMIGIGLLGLILLNFYLDSRRRMSMAKCD
jgi:hypothetical protein